MISDEWEMKCNERQSTHIDGLLELHHRHFHVLGAGVYHLQQGLDREPHRLLLAQSCGPVFLQEFFYCLLISSPNAIRLTGS